jgi:hypothetical protein
MEAEQHMEAPLWVATFTVISLTRLLVDQDMLPKSQHMRLIRDLLEHRQPQITSIVLQMADTIPIITKAQGIPM